MASPFKKKKEKKDPNKEELDKLATYTEQQLREYYLEKKHGVWELTWEMLQSGGWKQVTGRDAETGVVFTKHYKEYGKVFRLEGYVDLSVEETFKLLVLDLEDAPNWNSTLTGAQVLMQVGEDCDIAYTVTAPAAGGIIATRDFISLRHWCTRGDTTLSAGTAVLHPAKYTQKNIIRGENGPGGWVFKPVPGSPNRCLFLWLMNTDLKGWLPKGLVDTACPKAQLDYLENIRQYAKTLKSKSDT